MDTEKNNVELNEQDATVEADTKDEMRESIEKVLQDVRTNGMILGAQAICQNVVDKIYKFESSYGKKSTNDYKRCLKDIKQFCYTAMSIGAKTDDDADSTETTTQN